jgi:hypothetical protein
MATTVAVSNLTASTALASGDSIPFLDVSDTTQSLGGSVDRILVSNFFGATTRVPVGFYQGLGTVTVSTPALDSTATWNDGAVTFTHIKANITDTASAAASKLIDLQVGGTSKFAVTKAGAVSFPSDFAVNTSMFTVTGSNGNTAVAGTLAATGASTFTGNVRAGVTTGTFETGRGSAGATVGDLYADPVALTVYVGRISATGGDNSDFLVRNREAGRIFYVDTGDGIIALGDMALTNAPRYGLSMTSTTAPAGNPTGGGFLFVESGALKYRGTSGTVSTIAPA